MSREVETYNPQLKVTLHKTIGRKTIDDKEPVSVRFQGSDDQIDLLPYMGDGSSVVTSKSIREPAGVFTISLFDRPHAGAGALETLYGIIEPMDFIEIRMKHAPDGKPLVPIVMRGFISEVRRSETMGADGKPQRGVILVGQDYGKIWQILQIHHLPRYVIGQDLISGFKLFERYGVGFKTVNTSHEFIKAVHEKIINKYLKEMMPEGTKNPTEIKTSPYVVDDGSATSITGTQNSEGTLYELMKTYTDVGIWNELYTEDREDGVYVVFRPSPTLKLDGKTKIQPKAPDPEIVDIPEHHVISLNVSRTDANVANFYWVRAPRFDMNSDVYRQLFAAGADKETVLLDEYPNSAAALYGLKTMYGESMTGPSNVKTFNSGLPQKEEETRVKSVFEWLNERRKAMVEQNKDNVVLEQGSMRVFGNEKIRAGMYVRLNRGAFKALYYITQVEHNYVPFNGFMSTLTVERGLGFVERSKMGGGKQSPWIAERSSTS